MVVFRMMLSKIGASGVCGRIGILGFGSGFRRMFGGFPRYAGFGEKGESMASSDLAMCGWKTVWKR